MNNVFAPVDALMLPSSVCFAPLFLIETPKMLFSHRKYHNGDILLDYKDDDPFLRLSPDIRDKNGAVLKWIRDNIQDEHALTHSLRLRRCHTDWIEHITERNKDKKGYENILDADGGDYMRVLNMLNVLRTHDPEEYDPISIYEIFKRDLPFTKNFCHTNHLNELSEYLSDQDYIILPFSIRYYGLNDSGQPNALSRYTRQSIFNPLSRLSDYRVLDIIISPYFCFTHKYPNMREYIREINFKYLHQFNQIGVEEPFIDVIDESELNLVNIETIREIFYKEISIDRENPNYGETDYEDEDEEIEYKAKPFMKTMTELQDAILNYIQNAYLLHLYYHYQKYMKIFNIDFSIDRMNEYYISYLEISKIYQNKIRQARYIISDFITDAVLSFLDDFYRRFDEVDIIPDDDELEEHLYNWLDEDLFVKCKGFFVAIEQITGGDIFRTEAAYLVGEFDYEYLLQTNISRLETINTETHHIYMRLRRMKPKLISYARVLNDVIFRERRIYDYALFGSNPELIKFYKENFYDDLVSAKFKNWSSRHYGLTPYLVDEYNNYSVRFFSNSTEYKYDSFDYFFKLPHAIDLVIKMFRDNEYNIISLFQGVARRDKILSSFKLVNKDKMRNSFSMRRFVVSLQDEEFKRDVKLRLIRNRLNLVSPRLKWLKSVYDEIVINGLFECPICYDVNFDNDDIVGFRCSRCSCLLCQGCVSSLCANPSAACPLCRLPINNW